MVAVSGRMVVLTEFHCDDFEPEMLFPVLLFVNCIS